ncbi:MAG: 23S rRNA (pseudouridine(1915)-N(3))-methyltransferase RlmH [Saprospirales bacterium]|nr:MAG: 23S rRNA (pseudouridine(1915)-N(3))-methyltransferase RlmH [Saprospirales bacterium]
MKIDLIALGKTGEKYLKIGIAEYTKRLQHFKPAVNYQEIPVPSKIYSWKEKAKILEAEAALILKNCSDGDRLTLLDEKGDLFNSIQFAAYFSKILLSSHRKWILVIGGPYGFSPDVYKRADDTISLSALTFSHQMVRLFALEQLYRVQTIIHNQSYHHE